MCPLDLQGYGTLSETNLESGGTKNTTSLSLSHPRSQPSVFRLDLKRPRTVSDHMVTLEPEPTVWALGTVEFQNILVARVQSR